MLSKLILSTKFVFGLPIALFIFNWYLFVRLDIDTRTVLLSAVLHFLGGAAMAMIFFNFWERRPEIYSFKKNILINLVLVLGFVALTGILWELYEFSLDHIFFVERAFNRPAQPGLSDTMADLVWDLIGGTALALLYFRSSLYTKPAERI